MAAAQMGLHVALFFTFALLFADAVADHPLAEFSEVHTRWLSALSTPETAHLLQRYASAGPSNDINSSLVDTNLLDDLDWIPKHRTEPGPVFFPKCADDLVQILYNLNSGWALKMLDSNGKLMSGLLTGAITWPGNYQECLDVYAPLDEKDHGDFRGRYCMTSWSLNLTTSFPNLPLQVGVCVPDSCEGDDIVTAARNVLKMSRHIPIAKELVSRLKLQSVTCKTGVEPLDSAAIVYLAIICAFVSLVACGSAITAYGYLKKRTDGVSESADPLIPTTHRSYGAAETEPSPSKQLSGSINSDNLEKGLIESRKHKRVEKKRSPKDFFLCFCAFTNGGKILNTDVPSSQLRSIHGVRFLSLTWVIIGHTYITAVSDISNKLETLKDIDGFPFQILMQSPFSVDSFFLLSGTLLAYLYLKEADQRNGKISWIYFYLHRIWRITPVYMLVVGFHMLLYKYMGSGPFWNENQGDSCRHTWWWYLLYINNFIPIREMCVGWSWYLANDMQFYLLSPLFLYTLWRWKKVGFTVILAALVGSWVAGGVLSAKYDIIPMLAGVTKVQDIQAYQDKMWDSFDIIYDKPYTRISAYLVGILLGYTLYKSRGHEKFLSWWQQVLGWCLAVYFSGSIIFGLYHVELTKAVTISYNAFSRTSFVLGLAWMIFACETGHGGVLHKFLCWKFWIPLSRLTYCAYLVHPFLVHGYYEGLQTVLYFTHTTVVTLFLGILVASYVLAFTVSFTFESPMMNLEKWLLKRGKRSDS